MPWEPFSASKNHNAGPRRQKDKHFKNLHPFARNPKTLNFKRKQQKQQSRTV
jgi:hypothetical protein